MLVMALLFLFPAIYNVILAFQRLTPYDAPGDAVWVGLQNFRDVFADPQTGRSAFNTVFWLTSVTVAIRLVAGMALALLLHSPVLERW
jgi:ABC-type sugar transport system permease subunit